MFLVRSMIHGRNAFAGDFHLACTRPVSMPLVYSMLILRGWGACALGTTMLRMPFLRLALTAS